MPPANDVLLGTNLVWCSCDERKGCGMKRLTIGRARTLLYLMVGLCVVILIFIGLATWWDIALIESR
jgi:hypothetical protein